MSLADTLTNQAKAARDEAAAAKAPAADTFWRLAIAEFESRPSSPEAVEQLRSALEVLELDVGDFRRAVALLRERTSAQKAIGDDARLRAEFEASKVTAQAAYEHAQKEKARLEQAAEAAIAEHRRLERLYRASGYGRQELARADEQLRQHPAGPAPALVALIGEAPPPKPEYDPAADAAKMAAAKRGRIAEAVAAFNKVAAVVVENYRAGDPNREGEALALGRVKDLLAEAIAASPEAEPQLHDAAAHVYAAIGQYAIRGEYTPGMKSTSSMGTGA